MSEEKIVKKKSNIVLIVIMVLLIVIVVGGGAFGGYYIATKNNKTTEAAAVKPIEEATFSVDDFTLNLADPDSKKFIKTKIFIAYDITNKKLPKEVESKKPQMRDAIIEVLRSKKAADITQSKGLDDLKKEILNRVNPLFENGKLTNVYFYDIIVQ